MKVLVIGDKFPDGRVEKGILTALKNNYEVGVAHWGGFNPIFKELKQLPNWKFKMGALDQLGLSSKKAIKSLNKIIEEFQPDLLHVHDIFNARLAVKLKKKMIYDDHEFWSEQLKYEEPIGRIFSMRRIKRKIGLIFRKFFVRKWEKDVFKTCTVICAHPKVAEHHKQYAKNVFIVPNMPSSQEIEELENLNEYTKNKDLVAYIGSDISKGGGKMRKMKNFPDVIRNSNKKLLVIGDSGLKSNDIITSVGFVHHLSMFEHLITASWGIIGWEEHPFHRYCNPNKVYFYAHCGLFNIIPYLIEPQGLKYYSTFKNYTDLTDLLKKPVNFNPEEIIAHARENLTWECHESQIIRAYNVELELGLADY
jgi:hypothetical protein